MSNMNRGKLMVAMARSKVDRKKQHSLVERNDDGVLGNEIVEELSNKNVHHRESNNTSYVDDWVYSNNFDIKPELQELLSTETELDAMDLEKTFEILQPMEVKNDSALDSNCSYVSNSTTGGGDLNASESIHSGNIKASSYKIRVISDVVLRSSQLRNNIELDLQSNSNCIDIATVPNYSAYSEEVDFESVDDDVKDRDFNIEEYMETDGDIDSRASSNDTNSEIIGVSDVIIADLRNVPGSSKHVLEPLSDKIKEERIRQQKIIRCRYCEEDIATKKFMRHLQRNHSSEKEVENILEYPKNSESRRRAIALLRNDTNFDLYIKGLTRPNRQSKEESAENITYYPCAYCKCLFVKKYLKRPAKSCVETKLNVGSKEPTGKTNHISLSQTMVACALDVTDTISRLNVKEQVFDLMKGDEIAFVAKKDLLIAYFGDSYMKKHKRERMAYSCSNRMRELARLLINCRNLLGDAKITFQDLLQPNKFSTVVSAVREMAGFNPFDKSFKAPSLAMHMGTSLKMSCDELIHLILKETIGFKCNSSEEIKMKITSTKYFKKLVISRWNIELSSLANKDLQEKRWNRPLLVPLVSDIKKFKEECLKMASRCEEAFNENKDDRNTYKLLVDCTLSLLIIFNRRRIGDVQFLKIKDYAIDKRTSFRDFESVLTDTEKMLTGKYKRVVNSGKGSRAVVILVPEILQKFINILLERREKYIPCENEYVFASPGSKIKWGKGDVAIRTLAKKCNLENPTAISSNKLRKHIATVMQILNLTKDEEKQFSNFMGHTQKTHEEFYELPVDIYQTAKVSKLLLMMEKGSIPIEFKGKSLAEIEFDSNLEYVEEHDIKNDGVIFLDEPNVANSGESAKKYNSGVEEVSDEDRVPSKKTALKIEGSSDSDEEVLDKKIIIKKKGWSVEEVALLEENFRSCITKKIYPLTQNLKDFIKETGIKRTVPVVKSKLQHIFKTSNI